MARLVAFFVLALVLARVLAYVPIIGPLFAHTGIFGIWIVALLLSWLVTWSGHQAVRGRRDSAELRRLLAVSTPHTRGKAGSLLLARGRARAALPHLEAAAEGEPDSAEWQHRLGQALLGVGRTDDAIAALRRTIAIDPDHGYGQVRLRLAEALMTTHEPAESLDELRAFEEEHGPSPESAYRRGLALRALNRRDEARAAFSEVSALARNAAHYQRREAGAWAIRAKVASLR